MSDVAEEEQKGNIFLEAVVDELMKLQAVERELEREWWWLNGALHAIAQVSSGDAGAYMEMMEQKRTVDRKRVHVATQIAALVGPTQAD